MADARPSRPPVRHGEVVVAPPAEILPELARSNARARSAYRFSLLDVPAAQLAPQARAELLGLAREYTRSLGGTVPDSPADLIVATGHQPILPHPGIWLKNHLAWRVAADAGGTGLNFIVDNDTVELGTITVPAERADGVEAKAIPFVDCPGGVAAEEIRVRGDARAALAEAARLAGAVLADTLADEFLAAAAPSDDLVEFVSRPRRRLEEAFGVRNLELPVSGLSSTDAFRLFCAHIIANAEQFVAGYNAALGAHRAEHGITNPVEPVPDLRRRGAEFELPFWIWEPGGRRRPMAVTPRGAGWSLRGGDVELFAGMESAAAVAALRATERHVKIRPRALAMTMFFRLFCCDLFIHGMGGARYEPVNDAVIRGFFGADPPGYVAASATLFVGPKTPVPSAEDVAELHQQIRRMRTTPERFVDELLPGDAEARELARRRVALLDVAGLSKRERRNAFIESKKVAARLQERMAPHILDAEQRLARAETLRSAREALEDRAYPFFLHSQAALRELYAFPALGPHAPPGTAQGA